MFSGEREFTGQVVQALSAAGFKVTREVRVPGKRRLDIVAAKDNVIRGIEVKFNNRGVRDDLVKAQVIIRLPDVHEMYVCGPKVFMSEDVRALAANLGVGLLAMTDGGELQWIAESRRLPAFLIVGGGYGSDYQGFVKPGGEAVWNAAVFNNGQKTAVNVQVFMVLAGPFVARQRTKARANRPFLEGGPTA